MVEERDDAGRRGVLLRQAALVLTLFLVAGSLAGVAWYLWWSPAPSTNAYLVNGGRPFFEPDTEFRGTGLYLTVAVPLGLLLGLVCAAVFDRDEVVTLASVVVSAVLAGLLMAWVGHLLGPEAPAPVDLQGEFPDGFPEADLDLSAHPLAWFIGIPGGALVGSVLVYLFSAGPDPQPRHDQFAHEVSG